MKKVLIIEDNYELAENITLLLKESGYKVAAANNGLNGLKIIASEKPDLILCDIMLPDISGYKLLVELRKVNYIEQPVFIFITAKTQRQDLRKGMELGADDYLTKPFTFKELTNSINAQLEKRKKLSPKTSGRVIEKANNIKSTFNYEDHLFLQDKKNPGFYPINNIVFIKSYKDYTQLVLSTEKKIYQRKPMIYWETNLPSQKFVRIHRQTIVNVDFVEEVKKISSGRYSIKIKDINTVLMVSQRYSKKFKTING
jgi:DNA-binding LytR/AlgR family response regulator